MDQIWHEIKCYLCEGNGKLTVLGEHNSIAQEEDYPYCEGVGNIRVMKR